jgi:predicted NBD/HSP70 family sugar kinase
VLDDLRKSDRIVAKQLLKGGPASQAELVASTGLSRPTVVGSLTKLDRAGLAGTVSVSKEPSSPRRRAQLYQLTTGAGVAVGVEIGRRHITVIVSSAGHDELDRREEAVKADADDNPVAVLDQCVNLVREAVDSIDAPGGILGVAVGIPVPVSSSGQVGSKALPDWTEINPLQILAGQLRGLPVFVGNEADMGALGEYTFGVGRGTRDLTYVKLGTGIGSGTVLNGRLYRGASGMAGELGHITIDYRGKLCPCGNRGCLERYAGGKALLEGAERDGLAVQDLPDIVSRANRGDDACRRLIHEAAGLIGTGIGTMISINGPELVILGGSLSASGDLLLSPLRAALDDAAFAPVAQAVTLEFASLDRWASAWGAVAFVFERVISGSVRAWSAPRYRPSE